MLLAEVLGSLATRLAEDGHLSKPVWRMKKGQITYSTLQTCHRSLINRHIERGSQHAHEFAQYRVVLFCACPKAYGYKMFQGTTAGGVQVQVFL
jgi:hypothetical protein